MPPTQREKTLSQKPLRCGTAFRTRFPKTGERIEEWLPGLGTEAGHRGAAQENVSTASESPTFGLAVALKLHCQNSELEPQKHEFY